MKWFFAINDLSPNFPDYDQMIKVAVATARAKTPLEPHCLYDGDNPVFVRWLERRGVTVIKVRSRFASYFQEEAKRRGDPTIYPVGAGAFLRVEIPRLSGLFKPRERVLYTDCDVMFEKDPVPLLESIGCQYFAAGPEFNPGDYRSCNSGVMLMDIDSLSETFDDFLKHIERRIGVWVHRAWDQDGYNEFYHQRWTRLPPEMNWKPYWGVSGDAVVVHFHGPKPMRMARYRSGVDDGVLYLAIRGYFQYAEIWNARLQEVTRDSD